LAESLCFDDAQHKYAKGMTWLTGQHHKGRGREEKMTKAQQKKLVELIKSGPEANGFHFGIWNSAMIAEVIWLKFEVLYNLNYLSSLLKKPGLSYQKACFISDRQEPRKISGRKNRLAGKNLTRHRQKSGSRKQCGFVWRSGIICHAGIIGTNLSTDRTTTDR